MFRMQRVLWGSLLMLSALLAGYQVYASSAPQLPQTDADCSALACEPQSCEPGSCRPDCGPADCTRR